jgi:4-diphosphocytidyl-2-C-methyl-D-erythritol kinase
LTAASEIAPAKLNLALHVRGRLPDGRRAIETIFAFCTDGDRLEGEGQSLEQGLSLSVIGPFAEDLAGEPNNLVIRAARALSEAAGVEAGAKLTLDKRLPVASGLGGGSADAAAALRLLTVLWRIDPKYAEDVAPTLGSDVPACLLSLPARGEKAGDLLTPIALPELSGTPVLLVNPRIAVSTAEVYGKWDGVDRGSLHHWSNGGRNDLYPLALMIAPRIGDVMKWLDAQPGTNFVRMSGSGPTCFAFFDTDGDRDAAAAAVPNQWWHLATFLR